MSARTAFTEPADVRPPDKRNPADGPISCNRLTGSLKEATSWPGAALNTVVTLATALVAARADEEGSSYFQELSERDPADATAQALAGFFQVRAGHDVAAAITKLDEAATMGLGPPQYFRGLALAGLLPRGGPFEPRITAADTGRADQVVADLEFVLAARDQFPVPLLRAAYQGLARAYPVLGRQQQAAEARRRSGLSPATADRAPMFTSFSVTARDGMRLSVPGTLSPVPGVHVALSCHPGPDRAGAGSHRAAPVRAGQDRREHAASAHPGPCLSAPFAARPPRCGGAVPGHPG